MSNKPDKPSGTSPERATRRGMGSPPELWRDERNSSGAFVRNWPELGDQDEPDEPTTSNAAPDLARARTQELFDSQPRQRGPEYHPPALPAAARERGPVKSATSGTFRLEAPSVQVRPLSLPEEDAARERPEVLRSPAVPGATPSAAGARPGSAAASVPSEQDARVSRRFLTSAAVGLALGSAMALTLVRVPVRALGVLKTSGVPELLSAGVSGNVVSVRVNTGDKVAPGDPVLQIHSAELQRTLDNRRFELAVLREDLEAAEREEKAAQARNAAIIERRRQLLSQRLDLKDAEAAERKALLADVTALVRAGSLTPNELLEPRAALQATTEARLGIVEAISRLDMEAIDRRSEQQARERQRRSRIAEAEAKVRQAEDALSVVTVRAPAEGWIESLLVTPGSTVTAGSELARLVPRSAPRSVVALVALEDAAHVSVGEEASVEFSPQSQLQGTLAARIKHVSREVAPPSRVEAILGDPSTDGFVQLELDLLDSTEYHALEPQLRTGSKALVNLVTPGRRLGRVLYDALRDWVAFRIWR